MFRRDADRESGFAGAATGGFRGRTRAGRNGDAAPAGFGRWLLLAGFVAAAGCAGHADVPRPAAGTDGAVGAAGPAADETGTPVAEADPACRTADDCARGPLACVEGRCVDEPPAPAADAGSTPDEASGPLAARIPSFGTVFIIVLENMRYRAVIGNPEMPTVNELAGRFALAADYRTTHSPSLPNYLVMTAGQDFGVHNDDGPDRNGQDAPNLAEQLATAGIDWRAYMDGMSNPCQTRVGGTYAVKHNPFVYYRKFREDTERCAAHDVPFDLFAADLAAGPRRFNWITPDMNHNGHDTGPAGADAWLAVVVPTILASPAWKADGVLFIAWDEGSRGDDHIALVVASPLVRSGFVSDAPYDHRSLLATIEDGLGLPRLDTTADVAPMADIFAPPTSVEP
ncbi:MAG: hypothetical protein HY905_16495 [Deltaproteobacteria bacterium]|nr:hypothetical protein [Deltaproteobacteria bacterium]